MKLFVAALAVLLIVASAEDAAANKQPPAHTIEKHVIKAQRRTPVEILREIQSNTEDIVNIVIFTKDNAKNPVSSKENPKEIAMYTKFADNLNKGWDGCTLNRNVEMDVVEVTDPLAEELLTKLGVDKEKEFEKRTMTLIMHNGDGRKIQGPTAYIKIADELTDAANKHATGDKCKEAFFDKPEQPANAAPTQPQ